ncbi:MAG: FAD:protein FMN transferase, partial [Oscillospiraceae bacterium]|nr:FAD:protein FMN transferase [Oscillospiraceae bacterium]
MKTWRMKKALCLLLAAVLMSALLPTPVFAADAEKKSVSGFYMDTIITLTAYTDDEEILNDALKECGRYDRLLSRTQEDSDVWRINHAEGKPVTVSDDTITILKTALQVSEMSDGAFDVTIAPASTLWDFTSGAAVLPDADQLKAAAEKVDYTKLSIEGTT